MSSFKLPQNFELPAGKPAVLLLHAFTGSTSDVRLLAGFLNRAGFSAYGFNFTGHATLDPSDILTKGSPDRWRYQTHDAVTKLQKMYGNNIFVFGLSLGGIFAMDALESFPGVVQGGGVFSSPVFTNHEKNGKTLPTGFMNYSKMMQGFNKNKSDSDKEQELQFIAENIRPKLQTINQFQDVVQAGLGQIKQPVFIGQGGADEIIDQSKAYDLRDSLVQTKAIDFKWYEGASHVITTNTAKKQLQEDVKQFIENNYSEVY